MQPLKINFKDACEHDLYHYCAQTLRMDFTVKELQPKIQIAQFCTFSTYSYLTRKLRDTLILMCQFCLLKKQTISYPEGNHINFSELSFFSIVDVLMLDVPDGLKDQVFIC